MSVLAALRSGFSDKPENIVTLALAHVLRTYPDVRRSWLDHFAALHVIERGDLAIFNQKGTEQGQPDLQGRDGEGSIRLLVEAKFDAGLTENQPAGYLQLLAPGKRAGLVFLVPASRLDPLRRTFGRLLGKEMPGNVMPLDPHALALETWSATLDSMLAAARNCQIEQAVNDLRQIQGLCEALEREAFAPFRAEDLSGLTTPRLITTLTELVIDLGKRCRAQGWNVARASPVSNGHGALLSLRRATVYLQWSAVWWLRLQTSPLWLLIDFEWNENKSLTGLERQAVVHAMRDSQGGMQEWETAYLTPLLVPAGAGREEVLAALDRQIEWVRRALVAAGLDGPGPGPAARAGS